MGREYHEQRDGLPGRGVFAHHDVIAGRDALAALHAVLQAADPVEHPEHAARPAAAHRELLALRQEKAQGHREAPRAGGEHEKGREQHRAKFYAR